MFSLLRKVACSQPLVINSGAKRMFHYSSPVCGFEEFFDPKRPTNEVFVSGRAWTVPDLRRKSFDDLHKLWYVLYKERNLLLSEHEKLRRQKAPSTPELEMRKKKVKRSMAAIKAVLGEREKIDELIQLKEQAENAGADKTKESSS